MSELYLVLVRCGMDDLPVRVFVHKDAALNYADRFNPAESVDVARLEALLSLEVTEFIAVDVVRLSDGIPVEVVHHVNLED